MYNLKLKKKNEHRQYITCPRQKNMSYLHNSTWIGIKHIILSENGEMDISYMRNFKSSHKKYPTLLFVHRQIHL